MNIYLNKSPSQAYALIKYDNNMPLIGNGKLYPIFSYQPCMIKKKYNIDLKELMKIYPYEEFTKEKNEEVKVVK